MQTRIGLHISQRLSRAGTRSSEGLFARSLASLTETHHAKLECPPHTLKQNACEYRASSRSIEIVIYIYIHRQNCVDTGFPVVLALRRDGICLLRVTSHHHSSVALLLRSLGRARRRRRLQLILDNRDAILVSNLSRRHWRAKHRRRLLQPPCHCRLLRLHLYRPRRSCLQQ